MKLVFAFLAGGLTTLSPCVLPVLPFVTASSLRKNRFGPIFLALGILLSFVSISLLVSTSGAVFGIDPVVIRRASGVLLFLSGILFLSQSASDWFTARMAFFSNRAAQTQVAVGGDFILSAWLGEFLNGLLLGVVWTPCSGPSLGAALGLAGQSGSAFEASKVLIFFGKGAVIPLMAIAYGARHLVARIKAQSGAIVSIKKGFGILVLVFGALIVSGQDKLLEAILTGWLPDSWLSFVTQF